MTLESALPAAGTTAEASGQPNAELLDNANPGVNTEQDLATEGEGEQGTKTKVEKSPEQREIERLRRGIDRKTRQLAEARANSQHQQGQDLRQPGTREQNPSQQVDDEPLTLSRSELQKHIEQEARKLAPTLKQQHDEIEHRRGVVESLAKDWGQEKFDAYASDLDDVFGGLTDRTGRPKPATDAIFESDEPRALIEYLADPDNATEAENIGRMSAVQAGRAIAKLEAKLATAKAKEKPQRSNAPEPIERVNGQGSAKSGPDPSDASYMDWKMKQIQGRTF